MAYIPPTRTEIDFAMSGGYAPPERTSIGFAIGENGDDTVLYNCEFTITSEIDTDILWYSEFTAFETTTEIACSNIVLTIVVPAFTINTTMTGAIQKRVMSTPFYTDSTLSVSYIAEAEEGVTAVGPWPFVTVSSLKKPDLMFALPCTFTVTSSFDTPFILVDGSTEFILPAFETESVINSDICPILSIPDFNSIFTLDILAVKIMPEGDLYLGTPPLNIACSMAIPDVVVCVPVDALRMDSSISAPEPFVGLSVELLPLSMTSSISTNLFTAVSVPPLIVSSSLDTALQHGIYAPNLDIGSSIESDIFIGNFLVLNPLSTTSKITAGINNVLSLPQITATSSINVSGIEQILTFPALTSISTIDVNEVLVFSIDDAEVCYYYLTITGAADGKTDITIPMSSFQARKRSGEQTYLSVVVPTVDFSNQIYARYNGTMQIHQGYKLFGNLYKELLMETPISRVDVYEGPISQSVKLTGYSTDKYKSKEVVLPNATYMAINDGDLRYRLAKPVLYLNPGDEVTINDDTFTIGVISYSISVEKKQIEISEGQRWE